MPLDMSKIPGPGQKQPEDQSAAPATIDQSASPATTEQSLGGAQGEREYYSDNGVLITNKRVVTSGGKTIAVSQINSVERKTDTNVDQIMKSVFAFVGFFVGLMIAIALQEGGLVVLAPVFMFGGWMMGDTTTTTTHHFRIDTSNIRATNGFSSPDVTVVDEMVAALNAAIIENSQNSQLSPAPTNPSPPQSGTSGSIADELLKFKGLLDAGAINQDEYDAKKKELLGL
jgi:hypothetical protein